MLKVKRALDRFIGGLLILSPLTIGFGFVLSLVTLWIMMPVTVIEAYHSSGTFLYVIIPISIPILPLKGVFYSAWVFVLSGALTVLMVKVLYDEKALILRDLSKTFTDRSIVIRPKSALFAVAYMMLPPMV